MKLLQQRHLEVDFALQAEEPQQEVSFFLREQQQGACLTLTGSRTTEALQLLARPS